MSYQTDVFLSHNWGKDELGRDNHVRVSKINEELKKRGYRTWFDEERIKGHIVNRMADGIEQTKGVIVFITKKYHDKVTGDTANDNCRREFDYAVRTRTSSKMVAVVMEQDLCDTIKWKRSIGMDLGGKMFINKSGELNDKNYLNQKMKLLQNELQFMGIEPSNNVKWNDANLQPPTGIFCFSFSFSVLHWSFILSFFLKILTECIPTEHDR